MPSDDLFKDAIEPQYKQLLEIEQFYNTNPGLPEEDYKNIKSWIADMTYECLASYRMNYDSINHDNAEKFLSSYHSLLSYAESSLATQKADSKKSSQLAAHHKQLQNLAKIIQTGPFKKVADTCVIRSEFDAKCKNGEFDSEIQSYLNKVGIHGTKPKITDALNFSIENTDPDTIMSQLVWLAKNDFKAAKIYGNNKTSTYSNALDNLLKQIENSSPDLSMTYGIKLMMVEQSLKDLCHKKYTEFKANAPKNEDAELYAHKMLNESDEYITLEGINQVKSTMWGCRVLQAITTIGEDPYLRGTDPYKDVYLRLEERENKYIGDFINGDMDKYLIKKGVIENAKKVTVTEFDNYTADLEKEGYMPQPEIEELINDYRAMTDDKEKKSETFRNMENSLKDFLDMEHAVITDKDAYIQKLDDAIKFADIYYKKNSGYKVTSNGEKRRDNSHALLDHLNSYKTQLTATKELSTDYFHIEGMTDANIALKASEDALKKNISKDKYLEVILSKDKPSTEDLDAAYKDLQKTDETLEALDLTLNDKELEERTAIYETARKNYYSTQYDITSLDDQIRLGAKMDEYAAKDIKDIINNRDVIKFFCKYGNDTQAKLDNINTIKTLTLHDIDKESKIRVDEYHKDVAKLFEKRISELEKVDYSKYYNMSDKEFAENYHQFEQDCFPNSIVMHSIGMYIDGNPYMTKELLDRANALANKNSNIVTWGNERIQVMTNPNYIKSKNPILELDMDHAITLPNSFDLDSSRDLSIYMSKASGQRQYGGLAFADQIRGQLCTDPADSASFLNVSFYDSNGNPVDEMHAIDMAMKAPIIAINNDNPAKFGYFSATKGNALASPAKETPELKKALTNVLEKKLVQTRIDAYKNSITKNTIRPGTFSSDASSILGDLNMLNLVSEAKAIANGELSDKNVAELRKAFNILQITGDDVQFKTAFNTEPLKQYAGEKLLSAAKLDLQYKEMLRQAGQDVLEHATLESYDINSLNKFAKENNIPNLSSEKKSEIIKLGKKITADNIEMALNKHFRPSPPDRAYAPALLDPNITDEQTIEVCKTSLDKDSNHLVLQDCIDEMLMLDFDKMLNITSEEFMTDYKKYSYYQNLAFDYTYSQKPEVKGVLPESEEKVFQHYCEAAFSQLNFNFMNAAIMESNVGGEIDFTKTNLEIAAKACSEDSNNVNLWSNVLTMHQSKASPEGIKLGKRCYEDVIQTRWVNTLLGRPGISNEEVEFINDCIKGPDQAHGRTRLYEYAMSIVEQSAKLDINSKDEQVKSFVKSIGVSGKLLQKQMKADGYDVDPERLKALDTLSDKMRKVKGDVALTVSRGRALNNVCIEKDLIYGAAKTIKGLPEEKDISEKDINKAINVTTKLIQHFNPKDNINPKNVERFIKDLPLKGLKTLSVQGDFKDQVVNGYNAYKAKNNIKDQAIVSEPVKKQDVPSIK